MNALELEGAPPCIQILCRNGIPEGARNKTLFNIGVYLRQCYGAGWEKELDRYNRMFMDPPLDSKEIPVIAKSLNRKNYFYACKRQPPRKSKTTHEDRTKLYLELVALIEKHCPQWKDKQALASEAGVSESLMYQWTNHRIVHPRIHTVIKVADALGYEVRLVQGEVLLRRVK